MALKVGLRFEHSQAKRLRELASRVRQGDIPNGHADVFDHAASAAETGEPLIVLCESLIEADVLATGYSQYGVVPPLIEEMSGTAAR